MTFTRFRALAWLIACVWGLVAGDAAWAHQPESAAICEENLGEPLALAYGQHTENCFFGAVTDLDRFTFAGLAGQVVRLRLRSTGGVPDPRVDVRAPDGTLVDGSGCDSGCCFACSIGRVFTLPQAGTYTIAVYDGGADETGSYLLEIDELPPAEAPPLIPYDFPVTETIDHATDVDFLSFVGNAGSEVKVTLRSTAGVPDPRFAVRGPDGNVVGPAETGCDSGCCFQCTASVTLNLTQTGTYLVELWDSGFDESGTYEIGLQCLFGDCPTNLPPILDPIGDKTGAAAQLLQFGISTSDPNGDVVHVSAGGLPAGASLDDHGDGTATFSWTPAAPGEAVIVFRATDDGEPSLYAEETVTVVVGQANAAPAFQPIADQAVAVQQLLSVNVEASDTDGDTLALSVLGLPAGATFDDHGDSTGTLTWTPGASDIGPHLVEIVATDDAVPPKATSEVVVLNVTNVPQPEASVACQEGVGEPLTIAYGQHTESCVLGAVTDLDRFRFAGVAGEVVRLRLRSTSGVPDPFVEVRAPDGTMIDTSSCDSGCCFLCSIARVFTLPQTGTYVIAVSDGGANETGDYLLEIDELPPATSPPLISYDFPVTEAIDHSTDVDFLAFAGNAGTQVQLTLRSTGGVPDPRFIVSGPDGMIVGPDANGCDSGCCFQCTAVLTLDLTQTGTYLVELFDGGLDEGGSYEIGLQCLVGDCPGVTPPDLCGNGVLDASEDCDPALTPDCCTDSCTFVPFGALCRPQAGPCDRPELCSGSAASCPLDDYFPLGTSCRPAVGTCDAAETCTGASPLCPADVLKPSATVCRAAAGECDLQETCSGSSAACPTDARRAAGTACTSDGDPCTLDQCDGTNLTCQHPDDPGGGCLTTTTTSTTTSSSTSTSTSTTTTVTITNVPPTTVIPTTTLNPTTTLREPAPTTTTTTLPDRRCGNGFVDSGEQCDPKAAGNQCVGASPCGSDCTCPGNSCHELPEDAGCNDNNECTDTDTCRAGSCAGQVKCALDVPIELPAPKKQPKVDISVTAEPGSRFKVKLREVTLAAPSTSDGVGGIAAAKRGRGGRVLGTASGKVDSTGPRSFRVKLNPIARRLLKAKANGPAPTVDASVEVTFQREGAKRVLRKLVRLVGQR